MGETIGGRGRGVIGPMNESSSTIDGSEGGVGQDGSVSAAAMLASMKRVAPDFDFLRSRLGGPRVGTDCLLEDVVGIDACRDSGIRPCVASVGVGGKVCRFCLLCGCLTVAVESWLLS